MQFLTRKNRIAIIGIIFGLKKLILKKVFLIESDVLICRCADVQIVSLLTPNCFIVPISSFACVHLHAPKINHLHICQSSHLHIKKSFSQQIGPALAGTFEGLFEAPFFYFRRVAAQ